MASMEANALTEIRRIYPSADVLRKTNDGQRLLASLFALVCEGKAGEAAEIAASVNGSLGGMAAESLLLEATKASLAVKGNAASISDLQAAVAVVIKADGADPQGHPVANLFLDIVANLEHLTGSMPAEKARLLLLELRAKKLVAEAKSAIVDFIQATDGKPEGITELAAKLHDISAKAGPSSTTLTGPRLMAEYHAIKAIRRIPTGLIWFDNEIGGIGPGITVLAGQPGGGKSALAMALAGGAMRESQARVVWGLGEMNVRILLQRLACFLYANTAGGRELTMSRLADGSDDADAAVAAALGTLEGRFAVETEFTVDALEAAVIAHKADILVVDYFQRLRSTDPAMDQIERHEDHGRRLAEIAERHDVAILAVSSFAKSTIAGKGAAPIGAATKGSGSLDYDASQYFLLKSMDEDGKDGPYAPNRELSFTCIKNRHGPEPAALPILLDGSRQMFHRILPESGEAICPDPDLTF